MKGLVLRWAGAILVAGAVSLGWGCSASSKSGGASTGASSGTSGSTSASYKQNGGTATLDNKSYTATDKDESAVYVCNSGTLTLTNSTIKKGGDTSSQEDSSFYGKNAAVLAAEGSTINLSDCIISTTGAGANAAFSYGSGTKISLTNVTITATADGGHGVMATGGGTMILTGVKQETSGGSSSVIATDRGGGTIIVSGGTAIAHGNNSAALYSTGDIRVTGAALSATGAEAAVIEGSNSITLTDSDLSSSYAGKWGVMIYQSMSGDAQGAEGRFTMTRGTLSYTTGGPLFYVNNSTGCITLDHVAVGAASGILLDASANAQWGKSGANGGTANFTAKGENLAGDLTADAISKITAALQDGSVLKGAINSNNKAGQINLTLDATSVWTATANSHLDKLDGVVLSGGAPANVDAASGITIYFKSGTDASGNVLSGTYSLASGGTLAAI